MDLLSILGTGLLIMLARTVDVTIGTLRVISVIDGRMRTAFILGFVEVIVWIAVISVTLEQITEQPALALFFALGFSLGNVLGIFVERKIPLGNLTLRIVGGEEVRELAPKIRDLGLNATLLRGEGRSGENTMMFCFMPKAALKQVMPLVEPIRERVFFTLDYGGTSNRVLLPRSAQSAPPGRFFKRKPTQRAARGSSPSREITTRFSDDPP